MAVIDETPHRLTLINTFHVRPENAEPLIAVLVEATARTMRHLPGFVSASFHLSDDGIRVVNYAQWRSRADFEAMLLDEAAREHMGRAAALAERFEPVTYAVVHTDAAG